MQLPAAFEGKQGKCPSCSSVVTISVNAPTNPSISPQQQPVQQPPPQQPPAPQPPPTVQEPSVGWKERQQLRREQKGRIVRRRAIIGISACFGIVILIVLCILPNWYQNRKFEEIHQQAFDKYERAMQTYNQRRLLAIGELETFLTLTNGNPSISPEEIGDARQKAHDRHLKSYLDLEQAFHAYTKTYVDFGRDPPPDERFSYPDPPSSTAEVNDPVASNSESSRDARFYYNRGNVYLNLDELDKAIADLTKAIELDPQLALAYRRRGTAFTAQVELDKAIADYSKAIELDPEDASTYITRGGVYLQQHEWDKAIADYNMAIELDPEDAFTYIRRGVTYGVQGELDKKIADYSKAIQLDPEEASFYTIRGQAYYQQGDLEEAIADYSKAIELDPEDAFTYTIRGQAYYQQGDLEEAIADYTKSIEIDPEEGFINRRGLVDYIQGELDKAQKPTLPKLKN